MVGDFICMQQLGPIIFFEFFPSRAHLRGHRQSREEDGLIFSWGIYANGGTLLKQNPRRGSEISSLAQLLPRSLFFRAFTAPTVIAPFLKSIIIITM